MSVRRYPLLILAIFFAAPFLENHAAVIAWGGAQNVSYNATTQISTNGTYVDSFTYNSSNTTVNGVTFDGYTGRTGSVASFAGGGITVDLGTNTASQTFQATNSNASNVNSYGDLVARTGLVSQPANARISLVGLTVGYMYEIQLWQAPWDNPYPVNYSSSSDFTTGLSGNVTSAGSVIDSKFAPQFIIGTFVADASTQSVFFRSAINSFATGPSAGQLRLTAIPEPSTWVLMACALAFFVLRIRRRSLGVRIAGFSESA
jgi:hypothetical protein